MTDRTHKLPSISDYETIRQIGGGSYGDVWLVKSITGQYRALKVVARSVSEKGPASSREFLGVRKYEPISRSHPNLVHVLHAGTDQDGCFFYVMELADDVAGWQSIDPLTYSPETLESRLHRLKRLPVDEVLRIGVALTSAIDHLHTHDLIHRDIKLSNIVFVAGVPKLADIGLVCDTGARSFVGTEGYVPREGPGTRSADLYALGKVLYELYAGKDRLDFPELPPDWDVAASDGRIVHLNEVVLRACAGTPRRRYKNARQMHDQLIAIQERKESWVGRVLGAVRWGHGHQTRARAPMTDAPSVGVQQDKAARRLPVYFLLDCSGSMKGAPIQGARQLVRHMVGWLKERHHPMTTPIVSTVVAFERTGVQLSPVVPVDELDLDHIGLDQIECGGVSMFFAAQECAKHSARRELWRAGTDDGDIRPVAIWLTDGGCCDSAAGLEKAHWMGAKPIAVMVAGTSSGKVERQLGPDAVCIGLDAVQSLQAILDCDLRRMAQEPKAVFYPPGYDWTRHRVLC